MSPRDERGDTLVEILVAVVVIALAVTAIVGALVAGIGASGQHRNLAVEDTLLKSYADAAKQQIELQTNSSLPFNRCATATDYNAEVHLPPSTTSTALSTSTTAPLYVVQVKTVKYWDAAKSTFDNSAQCSDLQLIIVAATASGGATQDLSVVVRNPTYDGP
jgi:type II secretory pathway pseudopilin PulG